jgi:pteridine reductase
MDLAGRVALVTGAGHRLGRALALGLGKRGMSVAVHYHASAAEADRTLLGLHEMGVDGACFGGNLRDVAQARALPGRVAERFGRLDVVVNSAGVMLPATVEETTPDLWDQVMDLNLRAAFFVAQAALPWLKPVGGRVINIADVGGLEVWPRYAAHCISKAGVIMLTRSLALAMAPEVTVNAIAPGAVLPPDEWGPEAREHLVRTTPLRRLGDPDDVVAAALYLLERGDYVTGETIVVDGGRLLR